MLQLNTRPRVNPDVLEQVSSSSSNELRMPELAVYDSFVEKQVLHRAGNECKQSQDAAGMGGNLPGILMHSSGLTQTQSVTSNAI